MMFSLHHDGGKKEKSEVRGGGERRVPNLDIRKKGIDTCLREVETRKSLLIVKKEREPNLMISAPTALNSFHVEDISGKCSTEVPSESLRSRDCGIESLAIGRADWCGVVEALRLIRPSDPLHA